MTGKTFFEGEGSARRPARLLGVVADNSGSSQTEGARRVAALPTRDIYGRVRGGLASWQDITDLKEAHAALIDNEERYRLLFMNMNEVMTVYELIRDEHGVIMDGVVSNANAASQWAFGLTRDELVGRKATELFHLDDLVPLREFCREVMASQVPQRTEICLERSGRHYLLSGIPLGPDTYVSARIDITDMKLAEEKMREQAEALELADQRKDEFLAMLAHELRNPLAPVRNSVQALRLLRSSDPAIAQLHDIIDRQVTHMAHLLDDLLDVSRITQGKVRLHLQPVHLSDALAFAIETANPAIQGRRHTFTFIPSPEDIIVLADLDRLAQVVANLLTNAAKFTREGGQIQLKAEREVDTALVHVRDNGVGIAPEMQARIFDLFVQGDDTLARQHGGLGIGLTLVRSITDMLGGSVEVHSAGVGKGSEFIVKLPTVTDCVPEVEPVRAESRADDRKIRRILVVDDVKETAVSLAQLLSLWGHEVQVAYSGSAALEVVDEFKPDAVLLDIGLPGMDGYEVASRLRAKLDACLLIAQTGYGHESDQQKAIEAGFDHYLVKPLDLNTLRELLGCGDTEE